MLASRPPLTEPLTYPGMAHFAGGVPDRQCGQCTAYRSKGWYPDGTQMHGYCFKARSLGTKRCPVFPPYAQACMYFKLKEQK